MLFLNSDLLRHSEPTVADKISSHEVRTPEWYDDVIAVLHIIADDVDSDSRKASRTIHDAICALEPLSSEWGSND